MTTINLSVFILVILINSFASCEPDNIVTLTTEYGSDQKQCATKLAMELDIKGNNNLNGKPGAVGDKGPKGMDGIIGLKGDPGKDGRDGINGKNGNNGAKGARGDTGNMGPFGIPGIPGKIESKGLPGPQGDTGTPGSPGTCGCEEEDESSDALPLWGTTAAKPGLATCRNAPINESGTYYIYKNPIKVTCDYQSKKTCVTHSSDRKVYYTESKPFWLSQKNVSLNDIYNLESDQLAWLQRESFTANLTIRYHCMNSDPHNVTLMSWNDKTIDRYSTNTVSPFHYYIPSETDYCSKAKKTEWSSTDIILVSSIVQRLPVIDFFITDVKNERQALRIEIVQLCFG